jgi:hypothetical protein
MADYSTCRDAACGTTVAGRPGACPNCGGPMRRLRESKLRASVLIGAGLFLILFMGWIWSVLWAQLRRPGVEIGGSTFTGSASDAQLVELLFASVMAVGAASLGYGLYMLVSGRESAGFRKLMLGLLALLFAIGGYIRYGGIG